MDQVFDPNAAMPDFDAQNAAVERQRKVAEYLRRQAEAPASQGRMVGTGPGAQWVGPSVAEQIAKPLSSMFASYQLGQADRGEQANLASERAAGEAWRSALPQAVAAREQKTVPFMAPGMDGEENLPGTSTITQQASPAVPLTEDVILKNTLAGMQIPRMKDEALLWNKGQSDFLTRAERVKAAKEAAEFAAAERAEQKRLERVQQDRRDADAAQLKKDLLTQRMTTPNVNVRVSGGGGEGGFGGTAPVIGADDAGEPIYRHQKSGKLFQYNDIGAVVPYVGRVGAKPAAEKAPTEDQSKAAGWFKQADKAFKDMEDATREDPFASKTQLNELVAGLVPKFSEEAKTAVRTPQRQRFMQAAESMSEAVLRAATGAGVNISEAQQKVRELTPTYGEDPSLTRQKRASMIMYLESLKIRGGRALEPTRPRAGAPAAAGAAPAREDPLNLFGGQ